MKKMIAALLALILIFSFAGCGNENGADKANINQNQDSAEFKLPYYSEDSLNPYTCASDTNAYLAPLLYESLFSINNDYTVSPVLAEKFTDESSVITINLKESYFNDGSAVTANDVAYSFEQAKSSDRYKESLEGFSSASAKGDYVIRFSYTGENKYMINLLTFPIISAENENLYSGRYYYDTASASLLFNEKYGINKPEIAKITLIECKDYSAAIDLFNNDEIDYAFDFLNSGNIETTASNSSKAITNNLIFLGINSKNKHLKSKDFRKAISLAADQKQIVENAFQGYGYSTTTPFNPNWAEMGTIVVSPDTADINRAKRLLSDLGYSFDNMDIKLLDGEKEITLTLVVNGTNNIKIAAAEALKNQLINIGITVDIKKMPLDEFLVAVQNENFDLYIGEVKLLNDFNISCFFGDGAVSYGINCPDAEKAYKSYLSGENDLQYFISAFSDNTPFIPLCYKGAYICSDLALSGIREVNENDFYSGIENWSFK